jgi:glutamyl-tRNA synthetase
MPIARARLGEPLDVELLHDAFELGQVRSVTLGDLVTQSEFLFVEDDDFVIAQESWDRVVGTDRVVEVFDAVIAHLESCAWTIEAVDDMLEVISELGLKPRKVMPALYAAIEGRHAGLPLFDSIVLLGRDRTLARLRAARERLTE